MKKVKIFLASSIEDLREDRLQVGDFFRQLNEIYLDSGVHFSLVKCEDYDNSIASGGKQQQYDREIRESELVFFLFFRKVGDYTKHEFEVAMEAFKDMKKPRIVTYFRYITSVDEAVQEVQDFMQLLDREFGHYYNTYGHIDTLKLGILMQIKLLQLDDARIELKNGAVCLNGQMVVKAKNVPLLNGNQTLRELTAERKRLREELDRCRRVYLADRTSENKDATYDVSAELNRVSERLDEAEQDAMELLTTVAEMTSDGRVLTHRQKEALKYFNRGDYAAVVDILGKNRKNELQRILQRAEWANRQIQGYVEESLLLIEAIKAQGLTKEWIDEILDIYQETVGLVEKYDLDKTVLYDYAVFLRQQYRYEEAIAIAEKLNWHYANPSIKVPEEEKAFLDGLLGFLYQFTQRYEEAEDAYNKTVKRFACLAERNPEVYESYLAKCCNSRGDLYEKVRRYEEAEKDYGRAVEIFARLVARDPQAYESVFAVTCNILGDLYVRTKHFDAAKKAYSKPVEIFARLAGQDPETYLPNLARHYEDLGDLLAKIQRAENAIDEFDFFGCMEEQKPVFFEPKLNTDLGVSHKATWHCENAEEAYSKAAEIFIRLAGQDPETYLPDLARCYKDLGYFYRANRCYEKAAEAYSKALKIFDGLAEQSSEVYESGLAWCCSDLAALYCEMQCYEKAEEAYCRAAEIYTRLASQNPEKYEAPLAIDYSNLGALYKKVQRFEEAEEAYSKAVEIYIRLTERKPDVFIGDLQLYCRIFDELCRKTHHYEKAEEAYVKTMELFARLAEQDPEEYQTRLADTMWNLFELYEAQKDMQKLRDVCIKAQPLFDKLAKKYPDSYKKESERINEHV